MRRDRRSQRITLHDRYYKRLKHYRAIPLWDLLHQAYGSRLESNEGHVLIFHSLDGYERSVRIRALQSPDVYVAFEDLDHSKRAGAHAWDPLGPRRTNPGPYYVVWRQTQTRDTSRDPWVWALVSIDLTNIPTRYAATYPPTHTSRNSADSSATPSASTIVDDLDESVRQGHALFLDRCIQCHAINQQGGTLGPELNVPRNILEYRDREQLRAFIRDPQSFRYSAMPQHLDLSAAQLDSLLDYLGAMASTKHRAKKTPST
jgi:mono/diheme cytochrome c family protein